MVNLVQMQVLRAEASSYDCVRRYTKKAGPNVTIRYIWSARGAYASFPKTSFACCLARSVL